MVLLPMHSVLALVVLLSASCHADKDPNSYLYDGGNTDRFSMYYSDASNVLVDLTKFQYLYVRSHGCVWSEYGLGSYDDDGEAHDGDSTWYQPRTVQFRANAAYSLYGVLKGNRMSSGCSQSTYINSFFTLHGADTFVSALGLDVNDDGTNPGSSCVQSSNGNRREKSNDNNKNNNKVYETMGCTDDGDFVVATFSDQTCNGIYFLNNTDPLDDYTYAIDRVTCTKVWDLSKQASRALTDVSNVYGSAAETLLLDSSACDTSVYLDCPDPYGMKRKVRRAVGTTSASKSAVFSEASFNRDFRILSSILLVLGVSLLTMAYVMRKREKINASGGGVKGVVTSMFDDVKDTVGLGDDSSVESRSSRGSRSSISLKHKKAKRSERDLKTTESVDSITPPATRRINMWGMSKATQKSDYAPPGLRAVDAVPKRSASGKKRTSKSPGRTKSSRSKKVPVAVPSSPAEKLVDKDVAPGITTSFSGTNQKTAEDIASEKYVPPSLLRAMTSNSEHV